MESKNSEPNTQYPTRNILQFFFFRHREVDFLGKVWFSIRHSKVDYLGKVWFCSGPSGQRRSSLRSPRDRRSKSHRQGCGRRPCYDKGWDHMGPRETNWVPGEWQKGERVFHKVTYGKLLFSHASSEIRFLTEEHNGNHFRWQNGILAIFCLWHTVAFSQWNGVHLSWSNEFNCLN